MPRSAACLVLLTLFASCFTPDLKPRAGRWTYEDVVVTDSTCGAMTDKLTGEFTLTALSEGHFAIEVDTLDNPLDCSLEDDAFTCPESLLLKVSAEGMDATVLVTVDIEGSFASPTELSGTEVIRQSCTGADCEALIATNDLMLPCTTTLAFTGRAKEV